MLRTTLSESISFFTIRLFRLRLSSSLFTWSADITGPVDADAAAADDDDADADDDDVIGCLEPFVAFDSFLAGVSVLGTIVIAFVDDDDDDDDDDGVLAIFASSDIDDMDGNVAIACTLLDSSSFILVSLVSLVSLCIWLDSKFIMLSVVVVVVVDDDDDDDDVVVDDVDVAAALVAFLF